MVLFEMCVLITLWANISEGKQPSAGRAEALDCVLNSRKIPPELNDAISSQRARSDRLIGGNCGLCLIGKFAPGSYLERFTGLSGWG